MTNKRHAIIRFVVIAVMVAIVVVGTLILDSHSKKTMPEITDEVVSGQSQADKVSSPQISEQKLDNKKENNEKKEQKKFNESFVTKVRQGDTFANILKRVGVGSTETANIINKVKNIYDPSKLRAGQEIKFKFRLKRNEKGNDYPELVALGMEVEGGKEIKVKKKENGDFAAKELKKKLKQEMVILEGSIDSSLYVSATKVGIPPIIIAKLIKLYSYDVDFQRDIKDKDKFLVIYERSVEKNSGKLVSNDDILYVSLKLSDRTLQIYRYKTPEGDIGYYNEQGASIEKSLLRTPVDGGRITSKFGSRSHPILGYTRMHKGVDFGAPRGTPIYAAGRGRIAFSGRFSGYGNYIRIDHGNGYSTAYGHMNAFAKGISRGVRVKQGQVIGYVGSTGLATGPHLHFEVLKGGVQINPASIKTLPTLKLTGVRLANFQQFKKFINLKLAKARNTAK